MTSKLEPNTIKIRELDRLAACMLIKHDDTRVDQLFIATSEVLLLLPTDNIRATVYSYLAEYGSCNSLGDALVVVTDAVEAARNPV